MRDLVPAPFQETWLSGSPWAMDCEVPAPSSRSICGCWQWPDSETFVRTAFASLYGDPAWQEIRTRTNGPREMVLKYDIYFMHGTKAAETVTQLHGSGAAKDTVHELRLHDVYPGKAASAIDRMCSVDLPALKKVGGTTLGVFDIQAGPAMPGIAHFVTWPSYEARQKGIPAYEADCCRRRMQQDGGG